MKKIMNTSAALLLVIFAVSFIATGCSDKKNGHAGNQVLPSNQTIPSFVADTTKIDTTANAGASGIVREGVIDLKSIDRNKDGKVYECQMDYNVISDTKGTCPLCKMDLEEVSLQKAKENLKASGGKVK